ncbi:MAG: radical SAM protein [Candidatus Omnitrophota bacterium]
MVRFTKSLGIKTHLTFTFGLPGETQETIHKTIEFAKALDPDTVQFSITTAFPGTQHYKDLEARGHIVSKDPRDYDGNSRAMLRTEALEAKELKVAKQEAERRWQEHAWETRSDVRKNATAAEKLVMFLKKKIVYPWVVLWRGLFRLRLRDRILCFCGRLSPRNETLRKIKSNFLNLLGVEHGSYAFKGPDSVQIDLTSKCNNNCISCWCNSPLLRSRKYRGAKKHKTLPTPMVISLIDDLVGLGTRELYFSGGGEPFMHPDLMTILRHAKIQGLYCGINTNFTLVDEVAVKQLMDIGVDALTVSFWAANAASYGRTHPNKDAATFERMAKMLSMLNTVKDDHKPSVKVYNVISNLNYRELEEMVAFAEDTGSESVEFALVDTIPGATDSLILDGEQRLDVLAQCERILSGNYKVKVLNMETLVRRLSDTSAGKAEYDSGLFKEYSCYVGWVFSRIMSDGDVNFCLKAHRAPVGNLYQNSFRAIWNSAKQREFRRKALKFDKNDDFFHQIGNDEQCKVGCYKSCDDIGRNRIVQERLARLSFLQRMGLKALAKMMARGR